MAHFPRGDIERPKLLLELRGVLHEREQVGQGDELAVVQQPAHETRVAVTALFAVGDDVDPRPELCVYGKANRFDPAKSNRYES